MRDVARRLHTVTDDALPARIEGQLALVARLLRQKPRDTRKLYALHEPDVDCISKGKAHKRYEFGCKVSVATTHREGFVVGTRPIPGNPCDGSAPIRGVGVRVLGEARSWFRRPRRAACDCQCY